MSKMACRCGGVISDVEYPSATEGWLFREQDQESIFDSISGDIAAFIAVAHTPQRGEWIRQFFPEPYPVDISDAGMVNDIITFHLGRIKLSVCECSQCGRLYVQRSNDVNSYAGYAPIDDGYQGVLLSQAAKNAEQ